MSKRIAIGIPTACNPSGFRHLVNDLHGQRGASINLYVVANSPEASHYVDESAPKPFNPFPFPLPGIAGQAVDRPDRNLGVAASWNRIAGAAFAQGFDRILLINDDVRIHHDRMIQDFVCITDAPDGILLSEHRFSLFLLGRTAFEQVGPFDEKFWPGYYEDIDYVRRCRLAGVPIWKTPAATGTTHSPRTTGRELVFPDDIYRNRMYYRVKWGGDQGSEQFLKPFNGKDQSG